MPTRSKTTLKIFITAGLLAFVLYQMDLRKFVQVLSSANLGLMLLAVLVQLLEYFLATGRWRVILRNFNIHINFAPLAKITFIGSFFNLFLPSAIGGDVVRGYYLSKKKNRGMSTTLTTTLLERSGGLCALLVIGTFFATLRRIEVQGVSLLYVFLLLDLGYVTANVVLFHPWMHDQLTHFLKKRHFENVEAKLELVYEGLTTLRKNWTAIFYTLVISLIIQFFAVVIVWISARAIDITAPFYIFLIFIPLINLTIMVPLTINGIGLRESVYYLLFSQIGLAVETSVTLSLLNFVVLLVSALPGALIYSLYKKEEPFDQVLAKAEMQ